MKVLIVDDSLVVRRLMRNILSNLVQEIVEIDDGSRSFAAYTKHRPDLVLMDVQMKEMDGFTATREIKTAFPDARVLMVSQWDSPDLREAAREAGAEGYVNKANLLALVEIIQNHQF